MSEKLQDIIKKCEVDLNSVKKNIPNSVGYSLFMSPLSSVNNCSLLVLGIKPGGKKYNVNPLYTNSGSAYQTKNKKRDSPERSIYKDADYPFEVSTKLASEFQNMYKMLHTKMKIDMDELLNNYICHSNILHLRAKSCTSLKGIIKKKSEQISKEFWKEIFPLMKSLKCIFIITSNQSFVKFVKKIFEECEYKIISENKYSCNYSNYSWYNLKVEFNHDIIQILFVPHLSWYSLFANHKKKIKGRNVMDTIINTLFNALQK